MPNVDQMMQRMQSHLARVSGKALNKEFDRIRDLRAAGKISDTTAAHLSQTAPIRLAYLANAG